MCKEITYTDMEIYVSDGHYPKVTKLRTYTGDFVICHQHFLLMELWIFSSLKKPMEIV